MIDHEAFLEKEFDIQGDEKLETVIWRILGELTQRVKALEAKAEIADGGSRGTDGEA